MLLKSIADRCPEDPVPAVANVSMRGCAFAMTISYFTDFTCRLLVEDKTRGDDATKLMASKSLIESYGNFS